MRDILEKYQQRWLTILETLYFTDEWTTISSLSKALNCSERTIKQDIVSLRQLVSIDYLHTSQKGVCLSLPSDTNIETIFRTLLKESTNFKLLELLFHNENKTLKQIAELLYVSPATLTRMIKKINLSLNRFSLHIQINPCQIIGPEFNIRALYINYFMELYTHEEWPYPTIDQKFFENFIIIAATFVHFKLNFSDFARVKHWTAVSLIRAQHGHYDEIKENRLTDYIPDVSKFRLILKPLETKMNISFQPQFIEQVFSIFLNNDFLFSYNDLMEKAAKNPKTNKSLNSLSVLLETLSKKTAIPIPNKEHLLLDMYNISNLAARRDKETPKVASIIFDQKEFFIRSLEKNIPDFVELARKQLEWYQKKTDVIFSHEAINELIYTLVIHWEHLLIELNQQRKKAKLLIVSIYDLEHARMIRDIIDIHYPNDVVSEIYLEPRLSLKQLKKLDYNILITTVPFDSLPNKKVICIPILPTKRELKELKEAILEIRN
ncbi:helix-turn-helix domain-containing protein [Desemzia incerta]|uniref:helix-turn-helix domain-containing protein n=1 Tax=Desemzia incerta TaxID=82801 RepID=UPI003D029C41